jgi:long-chain fatty acid transport protein
MLKSNTKLTSLTVGAMILSSSLLADPYHYNDILIGDRGAGLGGAYAAIADGPNGLYYNPAGVVYATDVQISGSVNGYSSRTTKYSNVNAGEYEWTRTSQGPVANFFGVFRPIGEGVGGFSFVIPDSVFEDQDESFSNFDAADTNYIVTDQVLNYNNKDQTFLAGPSYSHSITKNFSVGLTLYYYHRSREMTMNQYTRVENKNNSGTVGTEWSYIKEQTTEDGFKPKLGFMYSPIPKLSLGLTVAKTIIVSQSPEVQRLTWTNIGYDKTTGTTTFSILDDVQRYNILTAEFSSVNSYVPGMDSYKKNDLPLEVTLAAAYFPSDNLLYSFDFTYYDSTNYRNGTWNAAFGTEYFFNRNWGLRGGIYTNNANTPEEIEQGTKYAGEHVDLLGATASLTRYTKGSAITIGFSYMSGSGEGRINAYGNRIQDVEIDDLSIFVSTATAF